MECFTVYADEIVGRLDPFYYKEEFYDLKNALKNCPYILERIEDLLVELYRYPTFYGINFRKEGVPVIKVVNITKEGILKPLSTGEYDFIEEEVSRQFLRTILQKDDLVMAVRGATIGKIAIIPREFEGANINPNLIRISVDKAKINPHYFWIYFNTKIGQKLFLQQVANTAKQTITAPQIHSLELPLPPTKIQNEIVQLMDNAYEIKKQKETEAQQLIDTINDYVLEELGIKLPELKDKMCYVVNADEVNNNRCDAYYYQPKFEEVEEALENGTYNVVRFDVLIKNIKNGVEIRKYSEEGYRYLRVTDLGEFGINDIDPRFVSVEKIPEKILLGNNSFLISRSGSLGLVSVVEEKIKNAILSSHIFKVDLDYSMLLPKYLESYFRSTVGQIQFFRNNNGGIVPEINQVALKSLLVILPPINIQNNIANEVKARMQKAVQLQKEAKEVLEEAKERVERIILGEEEI